MSERLTRYEDIEADRRADLNTEIAHLRAENERLTQERDAAERQVATLRAALTVFAEPAALIADGFPDHDIVPFRLGQCRDARAALAETEKKGEH